MAHEFESGLTVGQRSWHGLERNIQSAPTTRDAIAMAGLDWTVDQCPMYIDSPDGPQVVEGWSALRRSTDSTIYGCATDYYRPLQNAESFSWFDPFIADGSVQLETCLSLRGGLYVVISARVMIDQADISPGDTIIPYLTLSNKHVPGRGVWLQFTPIRVVCMNTLRAAEVQGEKNGDILRVIHSPNTMSAMAIARESIDMARRSWSITVDAYRAMRRKGITVDGLRRYVRRVFRVDIVREQILQAAKKAAGTDPDSIRIVTDLERSLITEQARGDMPRAWEPIEESFERSLPVTDSTVWGAYNSVTDWIDHTRGRTNETRIEGSLFGEGRQIRERATTEAMALLT